jgi:hypothetical protein
MEFRVWVISGLVNEVKGFNGVTCDVTSKAL